MFLLTSVVLLVGSVSTTRRDRTLSFDPVPKLVSGIGLALIQTSLKRKLVLPPSFTFYLVCLIDLIKTKNKNSNTWKETV